MLGIFKKKKEYEIFSPIDGKSIDLKEVPDKVFAQKLMGDGLGFVLEGPFVCAPCDGELTMVAPTLHAFGIKAENGVEILVHVGLDTVRLNGEGLKTLVKQGEKIKKGTKVIEVNIDLLRDKGIDLTTPMVITNGSDYMIKSAFVNQPVQKGESVVLTLEKK